MVEAATAMFRRYGFKRTSMDLLATGAGVAKPTVYAYFADKEDLFRAVVTSVCESLLDDARNASVADAPLDERVARMLSAKFTRYWELVQASPHAQELVGSQSELGGEIVQRFDRAYLKLLVDVLSSDARVDFKKLGLTASSAAQLLLRAASGCAYDATSAAAHRRHVFEVARVVLAAFRT